ncbi:raffinose synthase or seed imbibition protein Sip1-domain-containing protein [Dipodascopsis uninucleata]
MSFSSRIIENIIFDPPLSSLSHANGRVITFNAYVLAKNSEPLDKSFMLQVWWSADHSQWVASTLEWLTSSTVRFSEITDDLSCGYANKFQIRFVPPLNSALIEFTARYRFGEEDEWTWCGSFGHNGRIVLMDSKPLSLAEMQFNGLFENSSQDLEATEIMSQVVDSRVWKVTGVANPNGLNTTDVPLGKPMKMQKYLCLVNISSSWLGPRHGTTDFNIDRPGVMLLLRRSDGYNIAVIPFCNMKTLILAHLSSHDGILMVNISNDSLEPRPYAVFVGASKDPYKAIQSAMYSLKSAFQSLTESSESDNAMNTLPMTITHTSEPIVHPVTRSFKFDDEPVHAAWNEEWIDYFTFCTWNSMGIEVSEDKILSALQDYHDHGIRIGTVIIDDGWQSVNEHRQFSKFEANSQFPNGLKHTVKEIKKRFPYVRHVAVWHALLGYWNGIDPNGDIAKKYEIIKCQAYNNDIYVVSESDVNRFYNDFYSYLYECGITVVKADVQMHIYDLRGPSISGTRIHKAYQDAFRLHSLRYFYRRVTYCMAMSPQYFYYSLLNTSTPKPTLRNSDDFFPNIPSSHHWHIFCNAMNATMTSLLYAFPDWDMFMTDLEHYSSQHAASRCLSGGPVYITDAIDRHNMNIIKMIQSSTIQETSIVARPSRAALPIDPYFDIKDRSIMFLKNFYGGTGGFSFLGAFNVNEDQKAVLSASIKVHMLPGLVGGESYILRSFRTGHMTGFKLKRGTLSNEEKYEEQDKDLMIIRLGYSQWDIFTACPLALVKTRFKTIKVGAIGLTDQIVGPAYIVRQNLSVPNKGRAVLDIDVKAFGILGVYISDLSLTLDSINGLLVTIQGEVMPISAISTEGDLLQMDLKKSWDELGLESKWSNEIAVRIFIT